MTPFDLATGLRLGPAPVISVNVLADLGLSEADIARYFSIDRDALAKLREMNSLGSNPRLRQAAALAGIPSTRRHA